MKRNIFDQPVNDLIEDESPIKWISWLFDIQSSLIGYNHLEAMTDQGAKEFSTRFWTLKNFFEEIENVKGSK